MLNVVTKCSHSFSHSVLHVRNLEDISHLAHTHTHKWLTVLSETGLLLVVALSGVGGEGDEFGDSSAINPLLSRTLESKKI